MNYILLSPMQYFNGPCNMINYFLSFLQNVCDIFMQMHSMHLILLYIILCLPLINCVSVNNHDVILQNIINESLSHHKCTLIVGNIIIWGCLHLIFWVYILLKWKLISIWINKNFSLIWFQKLYLIVSLFQGIL